MKSSVAARERAKRWYANNRQKVLDRTQANRLEKAEYDAAYRETHRERRAENQREWIAKNPGIYRTKLSWRAMHLRCYSPASNKYENYGGRGIAVCERWMTFAQFMEDMGERPDGTTLDRIDNDGNYEPSNCRWSTQSEQNHNKRPRGAAAIAREAGVHESYIRRLVAREVTKGASREEALALVRTKRGL